MEIFNQEKLDGLETVIAGQNSLAYLAELKASDVMIKNHHKRLLATVGNVRDEDLFYLDTILVTTGWNLNTDVFLKQHVWAAKDTPANKPFNYEHDPKDIIGHILESVAIDDAGNLLAPTMQVDDLPDKFHLKTSAVLYQFWRDDDARERMKSIIAGILEGQWFVSMEAHFNGFDYALASENKNLILPRNESNAFLSKYLKAFGGTGVYENYRVGRVLKDITFCGKGLVRKPANPESVILTSAAFNGEEVESLQMEQDTMADINEDLKSQIAELKAELKTVNEAKAGLLDQIKKADIESVQAQVVALTKTVEDKNSVITVATEEISSLKSKLAEADKKYTELQAEAEKAKEDMQKMKKDNTVKCRIEQVVAAGKSRDEATAMVEKFISLDDAQFGEILTILAASKPEDKKDKGEDKKKSGDSCANDSATAGQKALENAEPEKDVNAGGAGVGSDTTVAGLTELFSNILTKSDNKKK